MPATDMQLRITPKPVRQLVEDGLREAIVTGRFAPGEHLPDRMLCELFGASRTVVREAVRLLEAEGLVTVLPHRGPFVAVLPVAEAAQIYEIRGMLEALAGEGFASRASQADRDALRAVHAEMRTAADAAAPEALSALKRRFYEVLMRGCGNAYVPRMLAPLLSRITQLRLLSMAAPGRLPAMLAEIDAIVAAVERRDAEAAALACRAHVRQAGRIALAALEASLRTGQTAPETGA